MSKVNVKVFGAEWCQACKFIKAMLNPISEVEYIDIDTEEGIELSKEFGVRGIPTYISEHGRGTGPVKNIAELKEVLGL